MLALKLNIGMAQTYMKCQWEDHCKHKIYPIDLTYLNLEASQILSTYLLYKRFAQIVREFNRLTKVTWMKVIGDCM